jgi:hypothetical protein
VDLLDAGLGGAFEALLAQRRVQPQVVLLDEGQQQRALGSVIAFAAIPAGPADRSWARSW